MAALTLAMQRFLWLIYRVFGLACLLLALHYSVMTIELERNFVPDDEKLPYFAICLALFAGTLFILPSTTPYWVKEVNSTQTATIAIAALVGLAIALISGSGLVLPLVAPGAIEPVSGTLSALVSLFTAAGVVTAGLLGVIAPKRVRRVPILERTAAHRADARLLRKARSRA